MIADVDATLRSLLRTTALHGTDVDVVFAAPTSAWLEPNHAATVNAYLYSVTEDMTRRPNDWQDIRDDAGHVTGRQSPLRRYRLKYLLTAWAAHVDEEHRLLSRLLLTLAEEQAIPSQHLAGTLADADVPTYITVAAPAAGDIQSWSIWAALGMAPHVALDVDVVAPLPRSAIEPTVQPVLHRRLSVEQPDGVPDLIPTERRDAVLRSRIVTPSGSVERQRGRT